MELDNLAKFHCFFHCVCLINAIGLASKCLLKFLENDNLTSVGYKKFHKNEYHIYPSISWCIKHPFLEHELKKYADGINVTSYSNFLQGLYWDRRMLHVEFDDVTPSLLDNQLTVRLRYHDKTGYYYDHISKYSYPTGWVPYFYVSFRSSARKCFTFDIPFSENKPVKVFAVEMRNNIFPRGVRPTGSYNGGFNVYHHYPGQRLTSIYTIKYDWEPKSNQSKPYHMRYEIRDVEANRHRIQPQEPCIEDWKNYDQIVMDEIMSAAGCRPPHWEATHNLSLCSNPNHMAYFYDQPLPAAIEKFGPPCTVIENLQYRYYEQEYSNKG